jgi:hypothetical protein
MAVEPFSIHFSQHAMDDLRGRLARTRWPDEVADSSWDYGFNLQSLQEICGYWQNQFDWKQRVETLATLRLLVSLRKSPFLRGSGSSVATTCNVGRKCRVEATLQPRRSLNCWPRTFAHSFANFGDNDGRRIPHSLITK